MVTRYQRLLSGKTLLFYTLSILLVACSSQPQLPRLSAHATILAFGDSLTYGTGAEPSQAYPKVLESLSSFKVVNAGAPGEVTAAGLSRLEQVLEETQPELMLLGHGGNDLIRKTGDQNAASNLRAMIKLTQQRGISVILIAVPRPTIVLKEPRFYLQIAKEFNIPILTGVLPKILRKSSMKSDAIHPNDKGYQLLAESLYALMHEVGTM